VLALLAPGHFARADDATATATTVDDAVAQLQDNQQAIADKEAEITKLQQKIDELRGKRDTTAAQAEIIASQVAALSTKLEKEELELQRTKLNIKAVGKQQKQTVATIDDLQKQIAAKKEELKAVMRSLYAHEQESVVKIFLTSLSLSDVLSDQAAYKQLQDQAIQVIGDMHAKEADLVQHQQDLEQQQQDLGNLQQLLQAQQEDLASQKAEQKQFLSAKKEEQVRYENLLAEAKQAQQEIQQQVFTLKSSGISVSLNNALDMARLAGKLTGVRPALLLGVLKVESNVGNNIGGGKFPDDMLPSSRDAFLRITKKLGLDPYNTPISARPRSYSGWGGAMGPAQIMPTTWEGIEGRIGSLLKQSQPSPYDLQDAFVATAIFLADRGATSPAGEYEAVNRYLAGPNWQRFTWYGDRVLAVAKEYAKQGL
jgi:peptidoglycan hydrolase CwlO-like protein